MSLHTQVVLILLFGVGLLCVVFGTSILFDSKGIRRLPPEQIAQAFPLWVGLIAAAGLACVGFATHFLLFGTRQLPFRYVMVMVLCTFMLGQGLKWVRSR